MRYQHLSSLFLLLSICLPTSLYPHCQVPCGIYDDHTRIHLMEEHIVTIEKGMTQIIQLSSEGQKNYNQIIRWVNNKDQHANEFQTIVTDYFMAQRIKPVSSSDPDFASYQQKLTLLHHMLVTAMKCKQSTDKAHVSDLREQLKAFDALYGGSH